MVSVEGRERALDKARGYVTKDRASSYGQAEDNFADIADLWNASGYRVIQGGEERHIDSKDVALMMTLMKIARLKNNRTHEDSFVDAIGYLACYAGIVDEDRLETVGDFFNVGEVSEIIRPSDVDVVKSVDAKIRAKLITPRPIKDNPQA